MHSFEADVAVVVGLGNIVVDKVGAGRFADAAVGGGRAADGLVAKSGQPR